MTGRTREDATRLLLQEEIRRLKARVKVLEDVVNDVVLAFVLKELGKGKKR